LEAAVKSVGLEIDQEFSKNGSIYAIDKAEERISAVSRVTAFVSPSSTCRREYRVEVMSPEPMVKSGTRCKAIANELQKILESSQLQSDQR